MQHFSAVNFNFSSQSSSASTVALTSGFSDVKSPRPRLSSFGFDVQESQSERRHGTCMATPERGLPRSGSISLLSKMIKDSPCVTPNSGNAGRDQDSTFSRQPNSEAINKTNAHMTSPSIPIPNETYLRDPKAIEERLRYHERRVTLREQMEVPDSNKRDVTAC